MSIYIKEYIPNKYFLTREPFCYQYSFNFYSFKFLFKSNFSFTSIFKFSKFWILPLPITWKSGQHFHLKDFFLLFQMCNFLEYIKIVHINVQTTFFLIEILCHKNLFHRILDRRIMPLKFYFKFSGATIAHVRSTE